MVVLGSKYKETLDKVLEQIRLGHAEIVVEQRKLRLGHCFGRGPCDPKETNFVVVLLDQGSSSRAYYRFHKSCYPFTSGFCD